MARKLNFVDILVGVSAILASIAIGVAMTSGVLAVPVVGLLVNQVAGWVIVAGGVIAGLRMFGLMK